jgi:class 3 adenylate cyclase/tetratricopeptide (TPR) repeat protein
MAAESPGRLRYGRAEGAGTPVSTENVAILFTDIVGSTELSQRLSAEMADSVRREHFTILRQAITESGGTEVKNLGDGLMVVFTSASAALGCAVAMQQGVEQENRESAEPVGLRVGLSGGEVANEGGDYFGDPVVEAARLCARCEGGQILATDIVRAMAGRRNRHECRSLGELELKGLPDPIETVEVAWAALEPEDFAVPLPSRIDASVTATFVGRAAEREVLDESLKAVTSGATRTVLISGEPGIGKTALSSGFARSAFEGGAVVLYGRCDEDLGIPYQPWAEALSHLVAHAPDDVLRAHVEARDGELVRLVPELAHRVPVPESSSSDAESERYLLFGAVLDLLTRVSAMAPVVLLLDDLHWSDRQSVQLLRHVVATDARLRILVIGTFRESDVGASHPLAETLAALHRESGVERIVLRGLGDDELLELLETTAGHEMTEDGLALRNALMAETEGNPFFVGEMLRHLAETGAIYQEDNGRWVASPDLRTSGLPVSIREVVGRRIARLGDDSQRMLTLAAVIGRDFDTELLSRVAELDEDNVIDLCDQAVTAAVLIESDGRYSFAHALVEHTLYDSLSTNRRARSHQRVADALEELCGDDPGERVGELAYHWAHATQPRDTEKAMTYAQQAGDRALAQLAPDEALRWYRDALDLLDRAPTEDPHRRAALLLGLGDAQRQTGDPAYRETLLDAAHLADDIGAVDLLVRAALLNNRGQSSMLGEIDHERVGIITQALDRLGDADSPDRARLLALLCLERLFDTDLDGRLALATQAVDMARRTGDRAALVDTIAMCHDPVTQPGTLELRRKWTSEAWEIAEDLDDPTRRHSAITRRMLAALAAGDFPTIKDSFSIFATENERIGQPVNLWNLAYNRTWWYALEGDLVAADEATNDALTLGIAAGQPDALTFYGAQLVNVRIMQGRIHELVPLIEQTVKDNPGIPAFRAVLARAKSRSGAEQEAIALLDVELANSSRAPLDIQWLTAHVLWAEVASRCKHRSAAAHVYDLLQPWHAQFATTHITISGSVAHFLGLLTHALGQYDETDQWFGEALACHERMQAPYFVALTQVAWAEFLADRDQPGDAQRARTLVDAALPVTAERGYGYMERDARELLERMG